jgi:hypothetical protein
MPLATFKRLAIILILAVIVTVLAGCSAIVADLVMLPFRVAGEAIEYAAERSDSDGAEETGVTRITGYCHDPSRDIAYPLYSSSPYGGECGPGIRAISRLEYDDVVARQAQDHIQRP